MRIVMLGDIVGRPGRRAVQQLLPKVKEEYHPDLLLANAENIAGGSGITPKLYQKLISYGLHGLTLGDHAFRQREILTLLDRTPNLIRPANLPGGARGRRWMRLTPPGGGRALHVITLIGRTFMHSMLGDDPFATVDQLLKQITEPNPLVLVEIHAEATSEKLAIGHYLDGRVSAVVGTHTHVPTADARILPGGTAYITDLGMTGPYDSILGRRKDRVLYHMTTSMLTPFDVAEDDPRLCGVFVEIDNATGRATACRRVEMAADVELPPFIGE